MTETRSALIVDDERDIRELLVLTLGRMGLRTDTAGSLSDARARSCMEYLVSKGIDKNRLQAKGYGSTRPIAPNTKEDGSDDPEGRQKNRRTEFKVLGK